MPLPNGDRGNQCPTDRPKANSLEARFADPNANPDSSKKGYVRDVREEGVDHVHTD
jgi:hypothetical protein